MIVNFTGYVLDLASVQKLGRALDDVRLTSSVSSRVQVRGHPSGSAQWETFWAIVDDAGVVRLGPAPTEEDEILT